MDRLRAHLRSLWLRIMALARPRRGDFDAELESHLAMHTADGVRAGLSREEARRQALVRLGGAEQARQTYRERRGLPAIESMARDVRYGVRTLLKHPALT